MECSICGKTINRPPSQCRSKKLFCSQDCYSEEKKRRWKGENNPNYIGGIKEFTCKNCGRKFKRGQRGKKERNRNKFCSIKCSAIYRGKNNRGLNHWNYKGHTGRITKPIRMQSDYEKWRLKVLERDNFKCQECGGSINLHVHHKKSLALMVEEYKETFKKLNVHDDVFYQIDNGKTLCKKCHKEVHKRQKKKLGELLETPNE